MQLGLIGLRADTPLFGKRYGSDVVFLLVYVNSCLCGRYYLNKESSTLINRVITDLQNTFVMTDLDPSHYFLGNEVE